MTNEERAWVGREDEVFVIWAKDVVRVHPWVED